MGAMFDSGSALNQKVKPKNDSLVLDAICQFQERSLVHTLKRARVTNVKLVYDDSVHIKLKEAINAPTTHAHIQINK